MQSPDREALYDASRKLQKALARRAGHRGSDERPRDHEPAGQRRDRSRQGGGARRHRQPDRERVLRRVRPALGVDDLRAGQRIQGAARARAAVPGRSGGAVAALLQGHAGARGTDSRAADAAGGDGTTAARRAAAARERAAAGTVVPLDTLAHDDAGRRPADGQPLRPAAGGHDLVRPRAGRVARRRADAACARSPTRRCPKASAASSRARPRRSRARSATSPCCSSSPIMVVYIVLGILYESYIHPLTILSGLPSAGFGALRHAHRLPDGSEHLRVRRHDHADRHRREERDHADRLRARSRARRHDAASRRSTRAA